MTTPTNRNPPPPTQNISPPTGTLPNLPIKNSTHPHLSQIYPTLPPPPQPSQKESPPTPTDTKYTYNQPNPPPLTHKKGPSTSTHPKYTSTYHHLTIKSFYSPQPPKIYFHSPPTTLKLNELVL